MKRTDINEIICQFKDKSMPTDRYSSFDYCFNYFKKTDDVLADIEKSCLVLGFYLASWGMFRASSFIFRKSVKYLQPTIECIADFDKSDWAIDVDQYTDENCDRLIEIYQKIKDKIIHEKSADLTLVTKVMLGVFGTVPAYDTFFRKTFREISNGDCGFRRVNKKSLSCIREFYLANQEDIDQLSNSTFTKDFLTGENTDINYSKAKIIDMYGFTYGYNM